MSKYDIKIMGGVEGMNCGDGQMVQASFDVPGRVEQEFLNPNSGRADWVGHGLAEDTGAVVTEDPLTPSEMTLSDLIKWQRDISSIRSGPILLTKANVVTYFAGIMTEAGECMNELNWKPWKAPHPTNKARVLDEFADILAFVFIAADLVCQAVDATPDEIAKAYEVKSAINRARLSGQVPGYEREENAENSNTQGL